MAQNYVFLGMAALVSFMIGLNKGGLGGTLGVLATPLMALVMPPDQVIGLLLPVLLLADVFAVSAHWRRWDWRLTRLLLPGAVIGVTVGTFFITNAPTALLKTVLGVIVLLFAVYKLFEKSILGAMQYRPHAWHGALAGTVGGFASALAHSGGPPIAIYLLMQGISPRVFVATSAIFFAIVNWIKVPYYFYAGLFDFPRLLQVLWILPLVPIGVWAGKKIGDHINQVVFERIVVGLLAVTAVMLIFD
jgi:uncharacterized membrane protein YfcA